MSLGLNQLLRMSALRNAVLMTAIFVVILIVAEIFLNAELERQVYAKIDHDLELSAENLSGSLNVPDVGTALAEGEGAIHIGMSVGFLTTAGENLGLLQPEIYAQTGIRTISEVDLFRSQYFIANSTGLIEDYSHHADQDTPAGWRVLVTQTDRGRLAVFAPIHEVEDALDLLPQIMWPISIAIVLMTLATGLVLGLLQQRRINQIQVAFEQIAEGNLGYRLAPESSRDDMDDLMHSFDSSAERLETSVQQMTDFSRNVAHELRTPLSELHLALEAMEDDPTQEAALSKSETVMRTFDAILRISWLSAPSDKSHMQPVDLNEIGQQLFDLYEDSVEESGQSLTLDLRAEWQVTGDRQLLMQLGSNLIENAMKYAGEGANITITAENDALSISDTGVGISEEDRERVLQPLFTLDGARSKGGTGLGLAVAQAIAKHHDAKLVLDKTAGGGLVVLVRFSKTT